MHYTIDDLRQLPKRKCTNILNGLTGIKSGNLIGSKSKDGLENLAVFNSVIHIGASPALMGFILRPVGEVPRHTYENILETGTYTINHIHPSFIEAAHQTSAKYDREESEFIATGLTPEYLAGHSAPFVKESQIKIGLQYEQSIPIPLNNTILVIGSVQHVMIEPSLITEEGYIKLETTSAGIGGLNQYYGLTHERDLPYARK